MAAPKAMLPFGEEVMLQRVARLLAEVVTPIVIVAAEGQILPECSVATTVVRDERADRGPMEGLRAGLKAMLLLADAAYVTSVDVPLLLPAFVRQMIAELGDAEVAVPVEVREGETFYHPLAAVYRTRVLPVVEQQLATDRLRLSLLCEVTKCQPVPVDRLRDIDPQLNTLRNLNCSQDYQAALQAAGFMV